MTQHIMTTTRRRGLIFLLITTTFLFLWATSTRAAPLRTPLSVTSVVRVPEDVADLQTAINTVPHGGVIDLANGTYPVPPGGFVISDLQKSFTIRARSGAQVVLDGQGQHPILRFINSDRSRGGPVIFENLTFANGYSTTDGWAGGVTLQRAEATFVNCVFRNNGGNQPSTGGGGVLVAENSRATFRNCTWQGNWAKNFGGGLAVETSSQASVQGSAFDSNRVDLPNHSVTAAGGAIHVGNSSLWVSDSTFRNNRAGYVGAAIYAIGTWSAPIDIPRTTLVVTGSTFEGNVAERDSSVSFPLPTEGGAIHLEDQAQGFIFRSTFIRNSAMVGGGINLYRANATVVASYFQGNTATGVGPANGFGGAISITSNDMPSDGTNNWPAGRITLRGSVIRGEFTSQAGAGIYAAGDRMRTYGEGGVAQMGSAEENRARVELENVIFYDTDVMETPGSPGTGVGGAILVDLADLTMSNVLIMRADAFGGSNSSGGALAAINQSKVTATDVTFADNTAGKYGAALFVQGSEVYLSRCLIIENEISPGVTEDLFSSYGAAIFTSPDGGRGLPVSGVVDGCTISQNIGLPIYDDDRTDGPINSVQYNNNIIYNTTFGDTIYRNSIWNCCQTVSELNTLVITRNNGTSSVKSARPNTAPSTQPSVGVIEIVPNYLLPDDTLHYIGIAWSGTQATLDGSPLLDYSFLTQGTTPKSYTLTVDTTAIRAQPTLLDQQVFIPLVSR